MFQEACQKATGFVRPVITSVLYHDGSVASGIAAFFVLNSDGWALTAGHIADPLIQLQTDAAALSAYDAEAAKIAAEPNVNRKMSMRKRLDRETATKLRSRGPYPRKVGLLWGDIEVLVVDDHLDRIADVLLVKLSNVEKLGISQFPTFKRPAGIMAGTSIVRVGYAFNETKCRYDSASGTFINETAATPMFASDGMVSRMLEATEQSTGQNVYMVETSSPGLKGQSGGPIMNSEGQVYAVQSATACYDLQFDAKSIEGGVTHTERQFLNVGRGISTQTLEAFFASNGVVVDWAD